MGVNNLPRVADRQCTGRELNPQPIDRESNALAITLPSHPMWQSRLGWIAKNGHIPDSS